MVIVDYKIKIGVAPTRRSIFSKEDALKFKALVYEKLRELNVDYVDIEDINEEGLLHEQCDVKKVIEKFRKEKVNALFFPHCNFGSEEYVCMVAKEFDLPILLWGPRDEAPLSDGSRLRDSQCGLFATGKILRRYNRQFTYIPNAKLSDEAFTRGVKNFVAAANVVSEFKKTRILQISTRPADFCTMMCNEGELLEKFGISIKPISMTEFANKILELEKKNDSDVLEVVNYMKDNMEICVPETALNRLAAMKVVMRNLAREFECNAIAIQCWNAMQDVLGVMPCVANALLTDEGIPVVCETDIHGAISAVMAQAAAMGNTPPFFADWTVIHPTNKNGELLQHCGPWPVSLMKSKPKLAGPFAFPEHRPGSLHGEIKGGDISILRFDGDHSNYSLLLGNAKGIEGPFCQGTYLWVEVKNMTKLEDKLVTGPYVHHCVGVHSDIVPVIYEACKYINGLSPDLYDDNEEEVKAWIRGE